MTLPDQRGTTGQGRPMPGEVTPGEVARRLDDIVIWLRGIDAKLDALDDRFVTRREFDDMRSSLRRLAAGVAVGLIYPLIAGIVLYLIVGSGHQ